MAEHYYSKHQSSRFARFQFTAHLRGNNFLFKSSSGVFSKSKLDKGTALLIGEARVESGQRVLDLGCGYGAVGIAIKKSCPDCTVVMIDVNERAAMLARKNARLNNVEADVHAGNLYEPVAGKQFDAILLNPPQAAGRALCNSMIEQAPAHLFSKGTFWLVSRHNVGGRMFEKKMKEVFGNVETVAKKSGYRVYVSTKEEKA